MDSVEVEVAKKFIEFITGVTRVRATIELLGGNNMSTDRKELVKTFIEELERHGVTLQIVDHDARIDAEIRESERYLSLCSELVAMKRYIEELSDEIARLVKAKEGA